MDEQSGIAPNPIHPAPYTGPTSPSVVDPAGTGSLKPPSPSIFAAEPDKTPEPTREEHIEAIRYQIDQLLKESDEHSSAYRAMHEILPHLDAIDPANEPSDLVGKSVTW